MPTKHSTFAKYRSLSRPNEDVAIDDVVPIIPPSIQTRRVLKRDYHREIAWTIDYTGDNDDTPTLLFIGAGYTLVKKIMVRLFGNGSPIIDGFRLYCSSSLYQRHAKAWVRVVVELKNLRDDYISLFDLGQVVENMIKKECWCNIRYMKLEKFLNI